MLVKLEDIKKIQRINLNLILINSASQQLEMGQKWLEKQKLRSMLAGANVYTSWAEQIQKATEEIISDLNDLSKAASE